jgi:zinc transport system ATP-binding protein
MKGWHLFPNSRDREVVTQILKKLGIWELRKKTISQLSGGERQKVLIARALAVQPKLLVMDEPTSAIDMEGQREILDLIESLEMTRIVVSHDIKILMRKVDKIAYIQRTGVIHSGPKLQIPLDRHFCEVELVELLRRQ